MNFKLTTSKRFYNNDDKIKLEELGFVFSQTKDDEILKGMKYEWYLEKDRFIEIEIENLEELFNFIEKWGEIVLSENRIEIYNDYRE